MMMNNETLKQVFEIDVWIIDLNIYCVLVHTVHEILLELTWR